VQFESRDVQSKVALPRNTRAVLINRFLPAHHGMVHGARSDQPDLLISEPHLRHYNVVRFNRNVTYHEIIENLQTSYSFLVYENRELIDREKYLKWQWQT